MSETIEQSLDAEPTSIMGWIRKWDEEGRWSSPWMDVYWIVVDERIGPQTPDGRAATTEFLIRHAGECLLVIDNTADEFDWGEKGNPRARIFSTRLADALQDVLGAAFDNVIDEAELRRAYAICGVHSVFDIPKAA